MHAFPWNQDDKNVARPPAAYCMSEVYSTRKTVTVTTVATHPVPPAFCRLGSEVWSSAMYVFDPIWLIGPG